MIQLKFSSHELTLSDYSGRLFWEWFISEKECCERFEAVSARATPFGAGREIVGTEPEPGYGPVGLPGSDWGKTQP